MKSAFFTIPLLALSLVVATGCSSRQTASESSDSLLSVSEGQEMMSDVGKSGDEHGTTTTRDTKPAATKPRTSTSSPSTSARGPRVPAGTGIAVRLDQSISSKTANVGDGWSGTVTEPVVVGGEVVIPAGTPVTGVVTAVRPAERGERAMIDLGVRSVSVNGRRTSLSASTEAVVAGSTRARNLGAIAGGAAAGALIGKAVGGSGKDAVIGGVIGGAAATGAVAASKGYQVVLKDGTVLTFTVNNSVALR